jgi:hypothetical protein
MKLIFIYNADSGPINTLLDIGHKILSPSTYQCNLCKLSHDTFSEKEAWRKFRKRSEVEMIFLHRDEFEKTYDMKYEYPIILKQNTNLGLFLSKTSIDSYQNTNQLIQAIENKIDGNKMNNKQ